MEVSGRMIKLTYTQVTEEDESDLENKTSVTTQKVTYNDIDMFTLQKVLKELDHYWDLNISIKLKEPPEDTETDEDEIAE